MATVGSTTAAQSAPAAAPVEIQIRDARSYWRESLTRLSENRIGMACGIFILAMAVIALLAPVLAQLIHHDAYRQNLDNTFGPPSASNWLGTDELGRDTLTRLMFGAQVSLGIGFLAILLSLTVGASVGLAAGYFGGWIDEILMRAVDILLSIPSIYLLILMSSLPWFRGNVIYLAVLLAFIGWGGLARLVRGEVLSIKTREFMIATKSVGAGDIRLMFRHLLPDALPVMIVSSTLGVGGIILAEAALDFIGLGVQLPTPSWGNMLLNSQSYFYHSLWLVYIPGAMIVLTVLATNIFGNALRDAFDPRLK